MARFPVPPFLPFLAKSGLPFWTPFRCHFLEKAFAGLLTIWAKLYSASKAHCAELALCLLPSAEQPVSLYWTISPRTGPISELTQYLIIVSPESVWTKLNSQLCFPLLKKMPHLPKTTIKVWLPKLILSQCYLPWLAKSMTNLSWFWVQYSFVVAVSAFSNYFDTYSIRLLI